MYGFQLLLEIGESTMQLITPLHYILTTILGNKNLGMDTIGHIISVGTAWLFLTSFKLISFIAPCQSATTEGEKTAVLVQKLLLVQHFDQDTVTELRLFSQQLLQRKLRFTAFGFLNLDYSLLFTILGGVTTYLVVTMQYI
jgi:gustatory receptor